MADGCKHRWDPVYPLPPFSFGSMLEIGSAKCHVLDLFVSLHRECVCGGAGTNVGRGICESPGSAAGTGLRAQDNTPAFDGARACSVGEQQHLCL